MNPRLHRAMIASPRYRDYVMALGPGGYWRLGESSGTFAKDETGINPGVYVNSPTLGVAGLLAGDPNTAVTLASASSQKVTVADNPVLRLGTSWTLAIRLKTTDSGATEPRIIAKRDATPSYELYLNPTGSVTVFLSDGTTFGVPASVGTVNDGATHLVVAVRVGTSIIFNIDNVAEAPIFHGVVGATNGTSNMAFGSYGDSVGGFLNATLSEPVIWNRDLAPAEIARLYAVGRGY